MLLKKQLTYFVVELAGGNVFALFHAIFAIEIIADPTARAPAMKKNVLAFSPIKKEFDDFSAIAPQF